MLKSLERSLAKLARKQALRRTARRPRRLLLEGLEPRAMMAGGVTATLANSGVLTMLGTEQADTTAGNLTGSYAVSQVSQVLADGHRANEAVNLNAEAVAGQQPLGILVVRTLGDSHEVDNTMAQAKRIATDGSLQTHSLHVGSDVDWVTFTLTQRSNVVLQTDGSSGDTEMWLYDASGRQIAYNDDAHGLFSRIDRSGSNALAPGTYYVKVGAYHGIMPVANYTISVRATPVAPAGDSYEVDDTMAQAKRIATDGSLQAHSLHVGSDVDWVTFTLTQRSNVVLQTNGSSGDTEMWLYDASGRQIAYNDDGNGLFSRIDRSGSSALDPGTYYVKVGAYGGFAPITSYTISVRAANQSPSRYMLCDNWGGVWTDVEKSPSNSDDDLMCWAAATSNVLVWTGWGQVGSNPTADRVFQYYLSHWSDSGSLPDYGVQWWFNGTNPAQGSNGWAQVEVAGGRYFPSQSVARYCHVQTNSTQALATIDQDLRSGWAAALGVYAPGGGHAITCWGFDYDPQNPQAYRGVWVTDSDDAKDQINPPDQLRYYSVQQIGGRWYLQNFYGTSNTWYIGYVMGLERRPAGVPLGNLAGQPAGTAAIAPWSSEALALAAAALPPTGGTPAESPRGSASGWLVSLQETQTAPLAAPARSFALAGALPERLPGKQAHPARIQSDLLTAIDRALESFDYERLSVAHLDEDLFAVSLTNRQLKTGIRRTAGEAEIDAVAPQYRGV